MPKNQSPKITNYFQNEIREKEIEKELFREMKNEKIDKNEQILLIFYELSDLSYRILGTSVWETYLFEFDKLGKMAEKFKLNIQAATKKVTKTIIKLQI